MSNDGTTSRDALATTSNDQRVADGAALVASVSCVPSRYGYWATPQPATTAPTAVSQ